MGTGGGVVILVVAVVSVTNMVISKAAEAAHIIGENQDNIAGFNEGHGRVVITFGNSV